jgi:hypothetical protein
MNPLFPIPLQSRFSRHADTGALILLALITMALLAGPLFEGNALYFRDLQVFFVPLKQFLADSLRQGVLPFWNPNVSLGTPFFAEMQTGVLYPPSWLLLLADGPRGIALVLAFHLWLAAAGALLFARSLGLSLPAALVSAASYAFGGCLLSSLNMINFIQGLAWLPLVLWAFERDVRLQGARSWVIAVLAVALQTLAGAPDVCIMTGFIVAGRQIIVMRGRHWCWLWRVGSAYILALLVTAPQLIATYELYTQSVRTAGLSLAEIQSYSLRFAHLSSLIRAPALSVTDWDIFAVYRDGYVPLFLSLYLGWVVLALVLCALWWRPRGTVFWWLLGGGGVFLALGGNNPAAMWIYQTVAIFRYPEKYVVLLHVGLSVMAGIGAQALLQYCRTRGWNTPLIAGVLGLALLGELLFINRAINLQTSVDYYRLDDVPEVRALAALPPGFVYTRTARQVPATSVRELYAVYRRQLSPHIGTLAGIRYVQGTEGLTLKDHALVNELLDNLPPSDVLAGRLGFFGTPYVVSAHSLFARSRTWRSSAQRLSDLLWRLPVVRPQVYFPATVLRRGPGFIQRAVDDPAMISGRLAFVSVDAEGTASSETDLHGWLRNSRRISPNHMEMDVQVDHRALLVWNESFYPGWRVWVNGVEQPLLRANHVFMGVWLEKGAQQVVFEFTPTGFYPGLGVSGLSLILLAWLYFGLPRWRGSELTNR